MLRRVDAVCAVANKPPSRGALRVVANVSGWDYGEPIRATVRPAAVDDDEPGADEAPGAVDEAPATAASPAASLALVALVATAALARGWCEQDY